MLRIGICDDCADARLALRSLLERLLERRATAYTIYEFSSGEGLLGWLGKHQGELELLFLDIEMSGISGMEAAKTLRRQSDALQLVFVTGYADHVFDGYAVGALGYLLKPPDEARLDEILTRALAALLRGADRVFLCRNSDGLYRIPKRDILYFCSDRRIVTCVTGTRRLPFYARLDAVADEVGAGFVRIHQRYLVRAAAVDRVESGAVVIREERLPVSRSCQQAALAALARAMLEDTP